MFFAMRSCEYSLTGERNPKTKLLTVGDVTFFDAHGQRLHKHFQSAHAVKIVFPNQKNGEKNEAIIRYKSNSRAGEDPVTIWGSIISRIRSYDGTTSSTPINTVCIDQKLHYIKATQIKQRIQHVVDTIGFKTLGILPTNVGTHSIRTSFATFLATTNVDVKYIMLQGRWKSDCVMRYIRKEIVDNKISSHILDSTNVIRRRLA